MKQGPGKVISASVGAVVSVLATISCCFPLGFAAALGAGAASAFLTCSSIAPNSARSGASGLAG